MVELRRIKTSVSSDDHGVAECWLRSDECMLRTRAHTFILQSRLAISLAWVAGYTNVIAVLVTGYVVSHVTGHASALGRDVSEGLWSGALLMGALVSAFFLGALISGFATEFGRQRNWASIYVLPAAIEIMLLGAFANMVRLHDPVMPESGRMLWWMTVTASVAMGLQNATITKISSGVVRTTHLTGIVTDLGHESAQMVVVRAMDDRLELRGDASIRGPSFQRLFLLLSIFGAFVLGSGCGAWGFGRFAHWSMLPPILLLCWIMIADVLAPICAIEEAMLAQIGGRAIPNDVAVFKAIPRSSGRTMESHLPDLAAWIARIPRSKSIVILDLSASRTFGPLTASSLHALFTAAASSGRRIIIAGVDDIECATINAHSRADLLHARNASPSLEGALDLASSARPEDETTFYGL